MFQWIWPIVWLGWLLNIQGSAGSMLINQSISHTQKFPSSQTIFYSPSILYCFNIIAFGSLQCIALHCITLQCIVWHGSWTSRVCWMLINQFITHTTPSRVSPTLWLYPEQELPSLYLRLLKYPNAEHWGKVKMSINIFFSSVLRTIVCETFFQRPGARGTREDGGGWLSDSRFENLKPIN